MTKLSIEDQENSELRKYGYRRLARVFSLYNEKLKREGIDLATPEGRIALIKQLSFQEFMDALEAAHSMLRGEHLPTIDGSHTLPRWENKFERQEVTAIYVDSPDFESPEHPEVEMQHFFEIMQREITTDTISNWAVKLFMAIIAAHMLADGNGRLARNAFYFLSHGTLLEEKRSSHRNVPFFRIPKRINVMAMENLKAKEGLPYLGGIYFCDLKHIDFPGEVSNLRFIAARRAGLIDSRVNPADKDRVGGIFATGEVQLMNEDNEMTAIQTWPWSDKEMAQYKVKYAEVRSEWFWEIQEILDKEPDIDKVADFMLSEWTPPQRVTG